MDRPQWMPPIKAEGILEMRQYVPSKAISQSLKRGREKATFIENFEIKSIPQHQKLGTVYAINYRILPRGRQYTVSSTGIRFTNFDYTVLTGRWIILLDKKIVVPRESPCGFVLKQSNG